MSSNPIVEALQQKHSPTQDTTNLAMDQMQAAIQMANGGNPRSILQNLVSQNPQLSGILNGNPEQMVRMIAQQRGLDVNNLISLYQQANTH